MWDEIEPSMDWIQRQLPSVSLCSSIPIFFPFLFHSTSIPILLSHCIPLHFHSYLISHSVPLHFHTYLLSHSVPLHFHAYPTMFTQALFWSFQIVREWNADKENCDKAGTHPKMDFHTYNQTKAYITAGSCFAIGLCLAGTRDEKALQCLVRDGAWTGDCSGGGGAL